MNARGQLLVTARAAMGRLRLRAPREHRLLRTYAPCLHTRIIVASLKFEGLSRNIQTKSLPDLLTCASAPAPVRPLSFERGPQRTDVRRVLGLSLPALSGHNLTRSYSTCTYTYMHN